MKCIPMNGTRNNKKKTLFKSPFVLISNNKTVISFGHRDQLLWPDYITIRKLDAKIQQS